MPVDGVITIASVVGLIIRACWSSFGVLRRKVQKQHMAPSVTVSQMAHVSYFTRSLAVVGFKHRVFKQLSERKVDKFL